jgi:hypothetical protein
MPTSQPGEDAGDDAEHDLVRVEDGTYDLAYSSHSLCGAYGGRLAVNFTIVTTGSQSFGAAVTAWYAVTMLDRKRGTFRASKHSKFARNWRTIFGHGVNRWDRVPMTALKGVIVKAELRTVIEDHDQQKLDPSNQYSVVARVLGRVS